MGKTYSSDREHQKQHFVRQIKDRYEDKEKIYIVKQQKTKYQHQMKQIIKRQDEDHSW